MACSPARADISDVSNRSSTAQFTASIIDGEIRLKGVPVQGATIHKHVLVYGITVSSDIVGFFQLSLHALLHVEMKTKNVTCIRLLKS